MQKIEKTKTSGSDKPVEDVVIASSGSVPVENPFGVAMDAAKV